MKICDHKSVGILVWRRGRLLLIERRRPPFGIAPPAGHVDEHVSYELAARAELREEVGLQARRLSLLGEGHKDNPCRRPGGTWHYWKIFEADAQGRVRRSHEETVSVTWYSVPELQALHARTQSYAQADVSDMQWRNNPGLEPVWADWFCELGILRNSK